MFGFEPKSLSDEQLLERYNDLMKKMSYMNKFSTTNGGVDMMQRMLNMIEQEQRERMFLDNWKLAASYIKKPIETDPDLANPDQKKIEAEPRKKSKRSSLPARTNEPVTETSLTIPDESVEKDK